jgi:hypothetical protein
LSIAIKVYLEVKTWIMGKLAIQRKGAIYGPMDLSDIITITINLGSPGEARFDWHRPGGAGRG